MKSFECSSPSELDRKFFGEPSLLSALSLEQLSASRVSNDTTADGSDTKLSVGPPLCLSSDATSPCPGFSLSSLSTQEPDSGYLVVPLQGKSSTPHIILQKPKQAVCFDQSYSDLTASQISWDVSVIKSEGNSPRLHVESCTPEQTWSPNPQQQSLIDAFS